MTDSNRMLQGISASPGTVLGKAYCCLKTVEAKQATISPDQVNGEINNLSNAIREAKNDLKGIYEKACQELPAAEAAIFEVHMMLLDDPSLLDMIRAKISEQAACAEQAVYDTIESYAQSFSELQDEYLSQRASDIREVGRRIICKLSGQNESELIGEEARILVAEDLGPAEMLQLDKAKLLGIITEKGTNTSHVAILARILGIPCVVGVPDITSIARSGMTMAMDGAAGTVTIEPDQKKTRAVLELASLEKRRNATLQELIDKPSVTQDGKYIDLWVNIGHPQEAVEAFQLGAQGIGLYRTEFLFMDRPDFPREEEQELAYRQVLAAMQGRPVVVRTIDIGADKTVQYLSMDKEENPFLGVRGVRLCLKEKSLFKTQLRALLKASTAGNLWIMLPMVTIMQEIRECKRILAEIRLELKRDNILVAENVRLGIMVETPAVALMADLFAKEVDFFSIGTNDLVQYTMASDRQNQALAYLNDPLNPAVTRLIETTVQAAKKQGIPVGMCGEMAGNPNYTEHLLRIGLDELSMSASSLLPVKEKIRSL
ncbi:MAG: ptsP [Firmicutes bacterium]|nr:ptsP [Bacillota bacterium]